MPNIFAVRVHDQNKKLIEVVGRVANITENILREDISDEDAGALLSAECSTLRMILDELQSVADNVEA